MKRFVQKFSAGSFSKMWMALPEAQIQTVLKQSTLCNTFNVRSSFSTLKAMREFGRERDRHGAERSLYTVEKCAEMLSTEENMDEERFLQIIESCGFQRAFTNQRNPQTWMNLEREALKKLHLISNIKNMSDLLRYSLKAEISSLEYWQKAEFFIMQQYADADVRTKLSLLETLESAGHGSRELWRFFESDLEKNFDFYLVEEVILLSTPIVFKGCFTMEFLDRLNANLLYNAGQLTDSSVELNLDILTLYARTGFASADLVKVLEKGLYQCIPSMSIKDLSQTLRCFAHLGVGSKKFFRAAENELYDNLSMIPVDEVSEILNAFTLAQQGSHDFYLALEKKIGRDILQLDPSHLSSILIAFTASGKVRTKFYTLCQKYIEKKTSEFNGNDFGLFLHSFSKVKGIDDSILEFLSEQLLKHSKEVDHDSALFGYAGMVRLSGSLSGTSAQALRTLDAKLAEAVPAASVDGLVQLAHVRDQLEPQVAQVFDQRLGDVIESGDVSLRALLKLVDAVSQNSQFSPKLADILVEELRLKYPLMNKENQKRMKAKAEKSSLSLSSLDSKMSEKGIYTNIKRYAQAEYDFGPE